MDFIFLFHFKTLENKFIIFNTGWVPLLKDREKRINNIDNEEKNLLQL